jgi:hypothetical protein
MADWITIRTFPERNEAEIVKSLLDSSGIPALIQADDMGGTRPFMQLTTGVRLLVARDRAAEALALLAAVPEPFD